MLIGLTHIAIDASWVGLNRRFASRGRYGLTRLLIDQTLHLGVIVGAAIASGYTTPQELPARSRPRYSRTARGRLRWATC